MKAPTDVPTWDYIESMLQRCNFVFGSTKWDGIRCLLDPNGNTLSSRLKAIPNQYIRNCLGYAELAGLDGELVVPGCDFHEVQSHVMSQEGTPDFEYQVFDRVQWQSLGMRMFKRIETRLCPSFSPHVRLVEQVPLFTVDDVKTFYRGRLDDGHEGVILRDPWAPYKFDRATEREGSMFKLKPNRDDEAIIIDFEPQMTNCNVATINEQGLSKRSTHASGMQPVDTLGVLICDWHGERLRIGGGRLTNLLRRKIWENKARYLGQRVTFTYLDFGAKELPRNIRFKGVRYDY